MAERPKRPVRRTVRITTETNEDIERPSAATHSMLSALDELNTPASSPPQPRNTILPQIPSRIFHQPSTPQPSTSQHPVTPSPLRRILTDAFTAGPAPRNPLLGNLRRREGVTTSRIGTSLHSGTRDTLMHESHAHHTPQPTQPTQPSMSINLPHPSQPPATGTPAGSPFLDYSCRLWDGTRSNSNTTESTTRHTTVANASEPDAASQPIHFRRESTRPEPLQSMRKQPSNSFIFRKAADQEVEMADAAAESPPRPDRSIITVFSSVTGQPIMAQAAANTRPRSRNRNTAPKAFSGSNAQPIDNGGNFSSTANGKPISAIDGSADTADASHKGVPIPHGPATTTTASNLDESEMPRRRRIGTLLQTPSLSPGVSLASLPQNDPETRWRSSSTQFSLEDPPPPPVRVGKRRRDYFEKDLEKTSQSVRGADVVDLLRLVVIGERRIRSKRIDFRLRALEAEVVAAELQAREKAEERRDKENAAELKTMEAIAQMRKREKEEQVVREAQEAIFQEGILTAEGTMNMHRIMKDPKQAEEYLRVKLLGADGKQRMMLCWAMVQEYEEKGGRLFAKYSDPKEDSFKDVAADDQ